MLSRCVLDLSVDVGTFVIRPSQISSFFSLTGFSSIAIWLELHPLLLICFTVVVVVDCGLTSHSAIFQLYSDGTDVQFPNFDLLPGTHAMGS